MGIFDNPLGHVGAPPGGTGTPTTMPSAVRSATSAEAVAGTRDDVYLSPAVASSIGAGADFANPGAIGSGTPNSGVFTTLGATTATFTTLTATAPSVAGASPVVNNSKQGQASFTDVIANGAYGTLTITNSTITASSVLLVSASCATANSAVQVVQQTPGAGTVALRVYNAGAASTAANILINYWVVN